MMAQCRFNSYYLIFLLILATTECKACNKSNISSAVLNSAVTLACPLSQTSEVIWEVIQGGSTVRIVTDCSSSCTTEGDNNGAQQRLCIVRTGQDSQKGIGSLKIRPVEKADEVWYRCTVQNGTNSSCSEVKIAVKDEPQFRGVIEECGTKDPYEATLNSTYTLQCPLAKSNLTIPHVIWGTIDGDETVPITRCPVRCTSSAAQRPLCERMKTMGNGTKIIINPVESIDSRWFWCAISDSTPCYRFRLTVKDSASTNQTNNDEGATQSPIKSDASSDRVVSSHATVITISSAMCGFLIVATLGGVYICFKKKSANTDEPENPYEDFKDFLRTDTLQYSFVKNVPETSYTCSVYINEEYDILLVLNDLENPYEND